MEQQKQTLVAMRTELRNSVDSYTIWEIAWDGGYFREMANKLYAIEEQIEKINKLLDSN